MLHITLEALTISLCWLIMCAAGYALSVFVPGLW